MLLLSITPTRLRRKQYEWSIWARLEDAVRRWNSSVDTVFVVTGAMAKESENDVVNTKLIVRMVRLLFPNIIIRLWLGNQALLFIQLRLKIPNDDAIAGRDYMDYACSVEDLEKITGFTFFPTLSADIKRQCDKSKWRQISLQYILTNH